jgi:tetratricopeptide (TPR) repeat protein
MYLPSCLCRNLDRSVTDFMKKEKSNKRSFSTETRCILLLITITLAAYANSFSGQLIFDDHKNITDNPNIRSLWPLTGAMSAPATAGIRTRPVVCLSLALNYALFGAHTAGYHAFNLIIHLLAGLTLFGIIRRTLLSERLRARFGEHATILAWLTAAIWAVHPIQTQSVTYIIQRCESLMGLFYLLTLYTMIRAMQSRRAAIWSFVSVLCCGLGMATKEVMVTAPVIVLLYDRAFGAGSFVSALRRRWGLYAGLAATWSIFAALMWIYPHPSEKVGFSAGISVLDYAMNECIVIVHYIRLSLWPAKLCLDYSWPVVKAWDQLVPSILMIVAMLGITIWGFIRNYSWSYLGVWFFGILAPTSSFVPIIDLIFEHRMYLSLAALILLFVITAYVCFQYVAKRIQVSWERAASIITERFKNYIPAIFMITILAALTLRTLYRNADYENPVLIWKAAINIAPHNPRAYLNLGCSFHLQGRLDEAANCYRQSLRLKPHQAIAESNLGTIFLEQGKFDEAIEHFKEALHSEPDMVVPLFGMAWLLATNPDPERRDASEAVDLAERAFKLTEYPSAWHFDRLAATYAAEGRFEQAQVVAEKALVLASEEHNNQLAEKIRERLELYKQAKPYRESVQVQGTSISDPNGAQG